MREVVIVSGARTPIGDFMGSLKDYSAVQLGTIALKATIDRAGIKPDIIEEVTAGHVYQAGCKGKPSPAGWHSRRLPGGNRMRDHQPAMSFLHAGTRDHQPGNYAGQD